MEAVRRIVIVNQRMNHRMLTGFLQRTKDLALRVLREGLTPKRFAATTAAGAVIALHPIYGLSTAACALVAQTFRLNHPWIQAVNYALTPVKIALIFPFLRFGEWLFRADPFTLSLSDLSAQFSAAPLLTLQTFAWTFVHAAVGWLVWVPIIGGLVYLATLWLVESRGPRSLLAN